MNRKGTSLAVLGVIVIGAYFIPLRFLRSSDDAKVFCSREECSLFVNETHQGLRTTPLKLAVSVLTSVVILPTPYSDQKSDTVVFIVTRGSIEKRVFERTLSPWGVYNGVVYGGGREGSWKWAGKNFQVLTDKEREEYELAGHHGKHLIWGEKDGWTAQAVNPISDLRIPLKDGVLEIHREIESNHRLMRLKLARGADTTWEAPAGPVLISKEKYAAIFGK